jgi:hypothetical protein
MLIPAASERRNQAQPVGKGQAGSFGWAQFADLCRNIDRRWPRDDEGIVNHTDLRCFATSPRAVELIEPAGLQPTVAGPWLFPAENDARDRERYG